VQGSTKVRNIKAARFINDALACVADERACHGEHLLQQTVDSLLNAQDAWRVVQYTPSGATSQCERVLDWPHEALPRVRA
jgi:hypothetical protein